MWHDLGLSWPVAPKASQAWKKEHSGFTVIHARALAEVTYSFYVLEQPTTFTDHCDEPRVFRVHFLVESRVNLDNWLYLHVIDSSGTNDCRGTEQHDHGRVTAWNQASDPMTEIIPLGKLQKVESMYKALPIITAFKSYMANWFLNIYNHSSWQREINQWEKNLFISRKISQWP